MRRRAAKLRTPFYYSGVALALSSLVSKTREGCIRGRDCQGIRTSTWSDFPAWLFNLTPPPTKFLLVINQKTAKALSLTVPPSILAAPTRSSSSGLGRCPNNLPPLFDPPDTGPPSPATWDSRALAARAGADFEVLST